MSSKRPREASPPWDIELGADNDFGRSALVLGSDHEEEEEEEEGDVDAETGAAMDVDVGAGADDHADVDMESDTDLAPALRAKRRRA